MADRIAPEHSDSEEEIAALLVRQASPAAATLEQAHASTTAPAVDVEMNGDDAQVEENVVQEVNSGAQAVVAEVRSEPAKEELSSGEQVDATMEEGETIDNGELVAPSSVLAADTTLPPSSDVNTLPTKTDAEVFKVPSLPTAAAPSSLTTLPADIEHILSLGANEGDEEGEVKAGRGNSNYEQVVREMREKAGFASSTGAAGGEGLDTIEKEMEESGITRHVEGEEDEDAMQEDTKPNNGDESSSDSDSSDSSDSDSSSDSDEEPSTRPTASTSTLPEPSDASNNEAGAGRQRNRKRPQKKRAGSVDSDLSDDDVNGGGGGGSAPKTEHEVVQPEIAMPKMDKLPDDAEISRFGKVESVIDTVVVVKADTGGDWRVLDEGTVCCWEDKTVIGAIFETFGAVQQPFYSLRFPLSSLPDRAIFTIGKPVFYAPKMATFVFTRDIRGLKGSDASNVWDEEVNANEVEFSDDEEEQEYRRAMKAERKARAGSAAPGSSRQGSRAPSAAPPSHLPARPQPFSYDDEAYTPLQRPRDLHLMGEAPPPAAIGRRMFERDTGRKPPMGAEAEFEFSDDDDETGSISSTLEIDERYQEERFDSRSQRGGRGGTRVAPLPARPAGLPPRPEFVEPESSEGGQQSRPQALPPKPASSGTVSPPQPQAQGDRAGPRTGATPPTGPNGHHQQYPPQYPSGPGYHPNNGGGGGFYPNYPGQHYPTGPFPPQFQPNYPGAGPMQAQGGGHFNPNFFGGQGGGFPPNAFGPNGFQQPPFGGQFMPPNGGNWNGYGQQPPRGPRGGN
ncbi:snoRNP assembly factor Naf1 [Pseudohyphozyma bogoriensis]|nr:snoRNP assembly factor Naf1 [Pseudohyphozyma bogoriensis]